MSAEIAARPRAVRGLPGPASLLEALPVAVVLVDRAERIRFVNAAAAELAGEANWDERAVADVLPPAVVDLVRSALHRQEPIRASDVAAPGLAAGRLEVAAAPIEGDRFVALTLATRGRAGAEFESRPVPPLARTLAHEVRNPLAGIRAAAQLIGRTAGPETSELADLICAEADRIRRLTDRIDALEGLPPPAQACVNVHVAIERVRQVTAQNFPEIEIVTAFDPSLPPVRGDLDQLIQALLNLVKNAAEAALLGAGPPRLALGTAFRPGVRLREAPGAQARGLLEIRVEDNGPGIPAEMQARAFEPFFTTKRTGQGLGLAVVAEIVARHAGRLEVESRPGRTVFTMLLPLDSGSEA